MALRSNTVPEAGKRSCPICGKDTQHAFRPFCSRRCADVDLAHWLAGGYVVSGGSADADEDGARANQDENANGPPGDAEQAPGD
jgi:endogenous inhibitor of DNA gyrase (YacG/DUF329 family)